MVSLHRLTALPFVAALVLAGACTNPPERPARTLAELSSARIGPSLRGTTMFFNDRVSAVITLDRLPEPAADPVSGHPVTGPYRSEVVSPEEILAARRNQTGSVHHHPPARLRLHLVNHGDTSISVRITAFNSVLGNFAVRPEHFTIAPGETAGPDPMTSRLGVAGTEIPVTVGLVLDGVSETRTIILRTHP